MRRRFSKILIALLGVMLVLAGCASVSENSDVSVSEENNSSLTFSSQSDFSSQSQISQESSEQILEESFETQVSSEPDIENSEEISAESSTENDQSGEDITIETDLYLNPLTGLFDMSEGGVGKRPVAIMVNNIEYALPQYGIESADIIFEIPAEGGITRFMAMFADYTAVPRVCSVRSCRKYFPAISEGFDAVYVNCGMNDVIRDYVNSLNLTQYDAYYDYRLFGRDQNRIDQGYAWEHTLYFDGFKLPEIMAQDGKRVNIEEDKIGCAFNFNEENCPPSEEICNYVRVNFGANKSGFTYDSENKKYLKDFNGDSQIDGYTGNQLAFTNLIILETYIGADENGMHREVNWRGGSGYYGYYISEGFVKKITWSKASEESRLMLYELDGSPLYINRGNSYISFGYIGETKFE